MPFHRTIAFAMIRFMTTPVGRDALTADWHVRGFSCAPSGDLPRQAWSHGYARTTTPSSWADREMRARGTELL
jgi:hypothetical protein